MFRRGDGEDRHDGRTDGRHARDRGDRVIETREVRMSEGDAEVTVLGRGARLEGTIVSAGSLRIDGHVKGKVTADGDVLLSPSSQVEADIHARSVTVAGTFRGNIVAKQKAELAKGGRVEGNVTSKVLVVAEGAMFSGQSVMDAGEASQSGRGLKGLGQPAARDDVAVEPERNDVAAR